MLDGDEVRPTTGTTDVVRSRIWAQLFDLVVAFVWTTAVAIALVLLVPPAGERSFEPYFYGGMLTLPLYGGLLEAYWRGQTVGKRITGVRVVDEEGRTPSLRAALLRNVPAAVSFIWLSAVVGLASIAEDERRQRLFDRLAETYVVDDNPVRLRDPLAAASAGSETVEDRSRGPERSDSD